MATHKSRLIDAADRCPLCPDSSQIPRRSDMTRRARRRRFSVVVGYWAATTRPRSCRISIDSMHPFALKILHTSHHDPSDRNDHDHQHGCCHQSGFHVQVHQQPPICNDLPYWVLPALEGLDNVRLVAATFQPRSEKYRVTASPTPLEAPVIRTVLAMATCPHWSHYAPQLWYLQSIDWTLSLFCFRALRFHFFRRYPCSRLEQIPSMFVQSS